eukprot:5718834-Pleurochrysis_carterae.AAC.1
MPRLCTYQWHCPNHKAKSNRPRPRKPQGEPAHGRDSRDASWAELLSLSRARLLGRAQRRSPALLLLRARRPQQRPKLVAETAHANRGTTLESDRGLHNDQRATTGQRSESDNRPTIKPRVRPHADAQTNAHRIHTQQVAFLRRRRRSGRKTGAIQTVQREVRT